MSELNYQTMTDEELVRHFKKLPWNQLAKEAGELEPERLAYVVREIEDEGGDKAAQRICVIFLGAKTKEQIEEMGKVLDTRYTLRIIHEAIKIEPSHMWKISSLLIGLTHRVFLKVLTEASTKELEIIQHQALREPVQHHLTLFVHDAEEEMNHLIEQVTELRVEIGGADSAILTFKEVQHYIDTIESFKQTAHALVEKIGRGLQIAWNTNRPDLVANLTQSKESALRFSNKIAGVRENWSGVYEVFLNKLEEVYGKPDEAKACHDDEPGVEAMTKLGLWYLADYWKIGLLPEIKEESTLKNNLEKNPEYREEALSMLNENLEKIGLVTVRDFKNQLILSKGLLKEYVQRHL